jgi:hypothetical protein
MALEEGFKHWIKCLSDLDFISGTLNTKLDKKKKHTYETISKMVGDGACPSERSVNCQLRSGPAMADAAAGRVIYNDGAQRLWK